MLWSVAFAKMDGSHTLEKTFEPGQMVVLAGVLGSSYLNPTKPCVATLEPGKS